MARQFAIVLSLVLAFAFSAVHCAPKQSNVEVTVVQNLTEYLQANPDIKLLEQLEAEPLARGPTPRLGITYKQGARIRGDALQATDSNSAQWATPQNVNTQLRYPKSGVGAVVTYVQVDVQQSTNVGRAYVTQGGIGQRSITLVIEAQQTLYFRYNAQIYGYY